MEGYFAYVNECTFSGRKPITFVMYVRSLTFTNSNIEKYAFYADECSKAGFKTVTFYEFTKDLIVTEEEEDEIETPTNI